MTFRNTLFLLCALCIRVAISPSYAGDIVFCDSFEMCAAAGQSWDCNTQACLCAEDYSVSGGVCIACDPGHSNPAGDDPTGGDTTCLAPVEASCVDGIINQGETGFQYKDDQPDELTGTECGGPHCAPCYDDTFFNPDSSYDACFTESSLADCIDGGAGNPLYHSYACTSNSCVCETYNADLPDSKGYWFDQGINNISGTQNPLRCDFWHEYCKENEYVDQDVSSCLPCPEGTTRRAGDDPMRTTTACVATGG